MILISLDEKKAIKEEFPEVHVVRTMKQHSKRHRYYMEEAPGAMRMLRKMRGEPEPKHRKGV